MYRYIYIYTHYTSIHVYIYICVYLHIYTHIYIYTERESERERERDLFKEFGIGIWFTACRAFGVRRLLQPRETAGRHLGKPTSLPKGSVHVRSTYIVESRVSIAGLLF